MIPYLFWPLYIYFGPPAVLDIAVNDVSNIAKTAAKPAVRIAAGMAALPGLGWLPGWLLFRWFGTVYQPGLGMSAW